MYVCGPTVYGPGHIGHARTYVAFDIVRKFLEFLGYDVTFVVNITDIHDDMIKTAEKQGITIFELAEKNIPLFFKDLDLLRIKPATHYPRVTQVIPEIIEMVKTLEEKGFAYETSDGVYFKISAFKDYGKLSRLKLSESKTGTRVETDKYEKDNPMDFVLWKKAKPGEPFWDSPWGKGRPGWHIECSVMSKKFLGEQFDIHGGAKDLEFPHHENEIAQSEAASGKKPFVKYWMHTGFLNVNGEKMSKSLGNFITLPELLKKTDPVVFRFFISMIHYSSPVDYNEKNILQAKKTLNRVNELISKLLVLSEKNDLVENKELDDLIVETRKKFVEAMSDDFNSPKAWSELFEFNKKINALISKNNVGKQNALNTLKLFREIDSFMNVFSFKKQAVVELPDELMSLIKKRDEARKNKNWVESDKIRDELREKGIELIDSKEGTVWRKIK